MNQGLMFCLEYLEKNFDWLLGKLKKFPNHYVIIDCPGQVELYTHHHSTRNILKELEKVGYRVCLYLQKFTYS